MYIESFKNSWYEMKLGNNVFSVFPDSQSPITIYFISKNLLLVYLLRLFRDSC